MSFLQKLFRPGKPQTSSNPPKAEAEDNIVISVVIPSYNARKTLASTLESLQKSQHTNLDVIVVDDGSEDRAEDIVNSFKDNRFRYFWKENAGPGLARNFGIDHAKGEYIFFLDADDAIYPDSLVHLLKYAREHDLDVVSGVTVRKQIDTGAEGEWFRDLYKTKKINTFNERLNLYSDTLSTNKLYRTQVLRDKNIYFDEGLYEDKIFTAKIYSQIDRIGLIDNRVYIWFVYGNQTSITTSKSVDNYKERMVAIRKLWPYLPALRKAYQLIFYINHDLPIYLREFIFYSEEEKHDIYQSAADFIGENKNLVYKKLVTTSLNRACLDALCDRDEAKFLYTANILSQTFQDEQLAKQKA